MTQPTDPTNPLVRPAAHPGAHPETRPAAAPGPGGSAAGAAGLAVGGTGVVLAGIAIAAVGAPLAVGGAFAGLVAIALGLIGMRVVRGRGLATAGAVVGGVALVLGGVVAALDPVGDDSTSGSTPVAAPAGAPGPATGDGGIPVGADGVAGQADADAVVVALYLDYMCPWCGYFEQLNGTTLDGLRESGDIVVEYHPVAILDDASNGARYSTRAATAAALVADQAPEAFLAFHMALFAAQPDEGTEGPSDADLASIARDAGVPDDVAARIEAGDSSFAGWVADATAQARTDWSPFGTPQVVIGGEQLDPEAYNWTEPGQLQRAIEEMGGVA